jgi:hypothetical protein
MVAYNCEEEGWYVIIATQSGERVDKTDLHGTREEAERQAAEIAGHPDNEKYMWGWDR